MLDVLQKRSQWVKARGCPLMARDAGVQLLHEGCGAVGGRNAPSPALFWLSEGLRINSSAGGYADVGNSLL